MVDYENLVYHLLFSKIYCVCPSLAVLLYLLKRIIFVLNETKIFWLSCTYVDSYKKLTI